MRLGLALSRSSRRSPRTGRSSRLIGFADCSVLLKDVTKTGQFVAHTVLPRPGECVNAAAQLQTLG